MTAAHGTQCRPFVTGVTDFAQRVRLAVHLQLFQEERADAHILIPHVKMPAVQKGISQFCMVTYRNFIVPMDLEFFMPPEKIPQALKALDVDGDGKISLADMRDAVIQVWPLLPAYLSCPACLPSPAIFVLLGVSCHNCPAVFGLLGVSCNTCPAMCVPLRLSCRVCPAGLVLLRLSCHACPVMFTPSCLFCLPPGLQPTNDLPTRHPTRQLPFHSTAHHWDFLSGSY